MKYQSTNIDQTKTILTFGGILPYGIPKNPSHPHYKIRTRTFISAICVHSRGNNAVNKYNLHIQISSIILKRVILWVRSTRSMVGKFVKSEYNSTAYYYYCCCVFMMCSLPLWSVIICGWPYSECIGNEMWFLVVYLCSGRINHKSKWILWAHSEPGLFGLITFKLRSLSDRLNMASILSILTIPRV